jgi:predicted Zn-ribbon and HTH transcriptional regulator
MKNQETEVKQIGMVMLLGARCRCGHEWLPREVTGKPRVCPKCKSANWDQPKRSEQQANSK